MGFKIRKSVKFPGGVRVNLSKRGVGVSVGVKGLRVSTGPSGTKLHTSIPGTGIRSTTSLGSRSKSVIPAATSNTATNSSGTSCTSAMGIGCLAIVALAIVMKLVSLIGAAVSSIWFWLVIALIGLGYVASKIFAVYHRQRLEKQFFDALIALSTPEGEPEPILSRLAIEMPGEADIPLLLAVRSASVGNSSAALAAIDMTLDNVETLGNLSGGLTLRFPGIVAPLSFALHNGGTNALYLVRNHLFVQLGRAREIGALPPTSPGMEPSLRALQLATAADASIALGDGTTGLKNLQEALLLDVPVSLKQALRYKLATTFEAAGNRDHAIAEYTAVLNAGGYSDAHKRLNVLVNAQEEELYLQTVHRMKATQSVQEIGPILDAALQKISQSATRGRLRDEASRIQGSLLERKRAELDAFEEQTIRDAIEQLARTDVPAVRETIFMGALSRLTDVTRRQRLQQEAARIEEQAKAAAAKTAEEREERAFAMGIEEMQIALTPEALHRARDMALRLITSSSRRSQFEAVAAEKIEEARARWRAEDESREIASFDRAVAKMESARGAAGRRAALDAGLREIADADRRDKLMAEASRIEVEAVLEKVDGLKTPAAKKRNLLAALDVLRNDDVPDELQAKQIQWLENALAQLEGRLK